MGELDPVTVESDDDEAFDDPERLEVSIVSDGAVRDREELREHRERVLAIQGLTAAHLGTTSSPRSARGELALAILYTVYVVPMGYLTLKLGLWEGELLASTGVVAFALVFLVWFWRSYKRAAMLARRTRVYDGVLVEKRVLADERVGAVAVFEGGRVYLPYAIAGELVPGVRYRVHAPDTEDVVVDVALDEIDDAFAQTAYRSPHR